MKTTLLHAAGVALGLALVTTASADTKIWTGLGPDQNWSTAANWSSGAPGFADNVVFGNTGVAASYSDISNVVDTTWSSAAGWISSLAYTNGTANSFHNTLLADGVTLNITNNTGPLGSALFLGTPGGSVANSVFASIRGSGGATVNINNNKALVIVNQMASSSVRATLNLTNLDNFTATISQLSVGSDHVGLTAAASQGTLLLARTNLIATSWVGDFSNPYTLTPTNAIEIGSGNAGNIGANFLYLGQTNTILTDSIGIGMVKVTGAPGGFLGFNPVFTNAGGNPQAVFRGMTGGSSRVRVFAIADNGRSGSSSATTLGTADFNNGTVDILADSLFLGRDRQNGTATTLSGTLSFSAGIVDANTLILGNQSGTTTGSGCVGTINVNGTATLKANASLELGHTTLAGGNALNTRGVLNVNGGTVLANKISVGAVSATNIIALNNAALVVTNTLATNAAGVSAFTMTNSTLTVSVPADASLRVLVGTLSTGGATNYVRLSSAPVLSAYPAQFPLIKYTNSSIAGVGFNLGLIDSPVTAPGAYLSNNIVNRSIDLVLPLAPYPAITAQPQGLALSPTDTANFSVTATGVAPLSYQWRKDGVDLTDGGNISGAGTSALALANVQSADDGYYSVVITNVYGVVTSSPAILFVSAGDLPPFVTTQPLNQTVITNQSASFTITAAGKPLPTYQWQRNGVDLGNDSKYSGVTTPTLTIANAQVADEGTYSVALTNSAGFTNSDAATLTVNIPPYLTTPPTNFVALNGAAAAFSVVAGGKPAPSYQWLKNGNPIPDETNATLSFAAVIPGDAATYAITVNNAAGILTSPSVTLIVNSSMAITGLVPGNNATGVCVDAPLAVTFDTAPVRGTAGRIRIYNATNTTTPVDTLDLSLNAPNGTQPRTISGASYNSYPVMIAGNTASIYPHLGVLTTNQTYYITIETVVGGAIKDGAGATFAGITASNVWRFTTKASGPANATSLVVAADGTGDFCTVQGVLDYLPANNTTPRVINVRNGDYQEIVYINNRNNLTFLGESRDGVQILYPNNDTLNGGTALRPSFRAQGNDNSFIRLTLTNSTPKGGSQAEAIRTDGKRILFSNVKLASYQDTMLNNNNGDTVYVENSLIQGDTDFIWGGGTAFFTNCEIRSLSSGSHITQARTTAGTNGFAFVKCTITRSNESITGCDFGRSLGFTDGNVAIVDCLIDDHITGWGDTTARDWEFGNSNLTASAAVTYNGTQLASSDPNLTNARSATLWLYGWVPSVTPVIVTPPANQTTNLGQTATFTVSVAPGPLPLTYQWLHEGTNAPQPTANAATLVIANAQAADAGNYSVVVANAFGSVTSASAALTVLPLVSPTVTAPALAGDGNFQFDFSGGLGQTYRIWASTNVTLSPVTSTWSQIGSGTFGSLPVSFTDIQATNYTQRYYVITVP